jgi:membrane-associated phospholipid phosphatase
MELRMAESILKVLGTHPVLLFVLFLAVTLFTVALLWHLIDRGLRPLTARVLRVPGRSQESPLKPGDSRQKRVGPYIALGILVGLAALCVFYGIADEVVNRGGDVVRLDHEITETIRRNAASWEVGIFWFITMFGSVYVLTPTTIGVVVVLLVLCRRISLVGWIVAALGGVIMNEGLKLIFERPRPIPLPLFPHALTSWSFPSGHAMDSLVIYGMLTYLLIPLTKDRQRKGLVLASMGIVLSIGFSRLYLGVHYFSDIIAGYAAGIFWLDLCILGTELLKHLRAHPEAVPRKN